MQFLISIALPFLVAAITAAVSALIWRDVLPSPVKLGLLAFLVLLGLHRIVQALAEIGKMLLPGGYFLEYQSKPTAVELIERQLTIEAIAISIVLIAIGIPVLYVLRKALSQ
jgi:hypothetical protein